MCTHTQLPSRYGYTQTKTAAKRIVITELSPTGIEWVILRPAVVYGPGSYSWGFEEARYMSSGFGVYRNQSKYVSGAVYVDDVAEAVIKSCYLSRDRVHQQGIFNIANPMGSGSWRMFYDLIALCLPYEPVTFSIPRWLAFCVAFVLELLYSSLGWLDERLLFTMFSLRLIAQDQLWPIDNTKEKLGWTPRTSVESGMQKTL